MRSDVKHLAPCGKESRYFCRFQKTSCPKHWPGCKYKIRTIKSVHDKNTIHPLSIRLTEDFVEALHCEFMTTAWCIDLARMAIGWDLVVQSKGYPDEFVQAKVREKIQKDKGIRIGTV